MLNDILGKLPCNHAEAGKVTLAVLIEDFRKKLGILWSLKADVRLGKAERERLCGHDLG